MIWDGEATGVGAPFCRVTAVDENTVWYISPRQTPDSRLSTDGGETWTEFPLPDDLEIANIVAILLRSSKDGYLLYEGGDLYVTAEAGQDWEKISLPLGHHDEMKLEAMEGSTLGAIRFSDSENGIVIVSIFGAGDSKVIALTTKDGGQTWQEEIVSTKMGTTYLTRDGVYLTIVSITGKITVFRHNID